jgi:phenylpropionate dioxygenase-like ring-hydroxylating dioxygenase large terminal subunit
MILNILLFLISISNTNAFLNYWNCIGFSKDIDLSKPYKCNIGDIPLVLWKNETNILSTINICKHLGSTLDQGWISNNCLVCPYHGLKHTHKDSFGIITECDGKIWWNMNESTITKPPIIPFKKYETSYITVDMNEDLPYCAYNSMDLNHPEYIHNTMFGFGSHKKPKRFKTYDFNDKVGISFEYYLKKNIKYMNYNTDKNYTYNFNMFQYPSTAWSCVQIGEDNAKMIIGVSMLPLTPSKTRWFVTVRHNYMNGLIGRNIIKSLTYMILSQDYMQFKRQSTNNILKDKYLLTKVLEHDEPIILLKGIFKKYKYPTINDIF